MRNALAAVRRPPTPALPHEGGGGQTSALSGIERSRRILPLPPRGGGPGWGVSFAGVHPLAPSPRRPERPPLIRVALLALGLSLLPLTPGRAADKGPPDDEVRAAIERGIKHLRDQQQDDGSWRFSFNQDHALGITALAGLALLENGVARDDAAVAGASEAVHALARSSFQTYDLALAILFLARLQSGGSGPDDELIRQLAARLAGGERGGMWNYTVPRESDDRTAERRTARRRIRPRGDGDNSNTQFALLGVWGASRHGFAADGPLEAIDDHFRDSQESGGTWGYRLDTDGSEAMTCAGLMGLAIGAARPALAERQTARARGAALAADPVFKKALAAVTRDARRLDASSDIYYLWSLERACVALGLRQLDGFDWYAAGARVLLDRQRRDGSWPDDRWGSLPNTCLALLFLRKANLAFELDRVLKLPGPDRPREVALADTPPPTEPARPRARGDDDVEVTIRAASEKDFPDIGLDFEAKRPDGSPVIDAQKGDFRVTEYGQEVPILQFESPTEVKATTVVLVVDRSLSMREEDRIGALKAAVATFLKVMPAGSRVAVIAFGSEVKLLCPFTDDPRRVQAAVGELTPAGATRYYDAVAAAFELIGKERGRRAILALTDGEDTFSQSATLDSVILAGRREGVPVHTLGLGSEDEIESDALRRLAAETRGRYFPARQADQLRGIYEEIGKGLGATYHLVYRTDRKLPDGTLRPVAVYYRASTRGAQTAIYIPGMVVPAAGWSRLFLLLLAALVALAVLPGRVARRRAA
jgi:VWFA-related protein